MKIGQSGLFSFILSSMKITIVKCKVRNESVFEIFWCKRFDVALEINNIGHAGKRCET